MDTKHNYYCEMCCNTFDQDDVHCPICGHGMVTRKELRGFTDKYKKYKRNIFGQVAAKLKAIYENLADYELKEAPKANPVYFDSPEPMPMNQLLKSGKYLIRDAMLVLEELESRLDERNR